MQTASVNDITPSKPKVPMREAAAILAELCHRLDDGEEPTSAIQAVFAETRLDLAEAIDRRKAVKAILERQAEAARAMAKDLTAHAQKMDAAVEALKADTKLIMEAMPDLPYRDSAGRKVSIVKNQPSLVIDLNLGEKRITHIIDAQQMHELNVPLQFVEPVSFYRLDTKALKEALEAGATCSWARLEQSNHIRGL